MRNSEEPEVMIVATIAWGLCKSSRAIVLTLIFSIALKPGFIHAVYSLLDHASSGDFVKIAGLACFCSVYNHGSDMLFSYSTIVQHTPFPPIGWSILKAGLNKSVLLSVYTPSSREREPTNSFNA
ncbi:unnamed protein product [Camellia sinensis]